MMDAHFAIAKRHICSAVTEKQRDVILPEHVLEEHIYDVGLPNTAVELIIVKRNHGNLKRWLEAIKKNVAALGNVYS